jgi:hypothetical protein
VSSVNPPQESKLSEQKLEQIRRQINRLFEEVAQLAEQPLEATAFYGEFLPRVLTGLAAPAGVVWGRTGEGHLQIQYQVNLQMAGLDTDEAGRQSHAELLRQTCMQGKPQIVPAHSGGGADDGAPTPGNPTDYVILLVPIVVDRIIAGVVEVFQDPRHSPEAMPGFLNFLIRMAGLASVYVRNLQLRQLTGQQQIWLDLEKFSRQIHASLNPAEVAYLVANEGRRLVQCDRLSVAVRDGRKLAIEAISGADVVEKRSNLVQLQCKLAQKVAEWGERLVYQGSKDDSLPPPVLGALDEYLAESNSKLLIVMPLQDDREKETKRLPRSALLLESFEPPASPEQILARLDVVGKHAASALFNASEHRRIPLRFLWQPLARLQEGLGSRARAIAATIVGTILFALVLLVVIPYPLKMDAKGQLLPEDRRWVFAPVEGQVVRFPEYVQTGSTVLKGQVLIEMRDQKLELKLHELNGEIAKAEAEIAALRPLFVQTSLSQAEKLRIIAEQRQQEVLLARKRTERDTLVDRADALLERPGVFLIRAPIGGTILNSDFRENLLNRTVKPSDPLLRIGDKDRGWEIELKIPQRHIGQVRMAFAANDPNHELDVDLLLASAPTQTYKGKLSQAKIAGEAHPNKDDPNDTEPVVVASVRIEGEGIAKSDQLPPELLVTGTVVHAKVRCGNRPMGYSLFYGVWEFIYEKIVFFF